VSALQHFIGLADAGGGADEYLESTEAGVLSLCCFQQSFGQGALLSRITALICHKAL